MAKIKSPQEPTGWQEQAAIWLGKCIVHRQQQLSSWLEKQCQKLNAAQRKVLVLFVLLASTLYLFCLLLRSLSGVAAPAQYKFPTGRFLEQQVPPDPGPSGSTSAVIRIHHPKNNPYGTKN